MWRVVPVVVFVAVSACTEPPVEVVSPAGVPEHPTPAAPTAPDEPPVADEPPACVPVADADDRCQGGPLCTDLDLVEPSWTVETDYVLGEAQLVGDVNADGLPDLLVGLGFGDSQPLSVVVFAPFVRERVLPRDADLVVHGSVVTFADLDRDGILDVLGSHPDPTGWDPVHYAFVPGPLPADIDLEARATVSIQRSNALPYTFFTDSDGDGRVEYSESWPGVAEVWRTDPSGWGVGEPTLTVEAPCGLSGYETENTLVGGSCEDQNGDGIDEIVVDVGGAYGTCPQYLVPPGLTGVFRPETDPRATLGTCARPAGDQDGDGIGDYQLGEAVHAGPIAFVGGEITSLPLFSGEGVPLQVDLTGDGVPDFVDTLQRGSDRVEGATPIAVLAGGPSGGVATADPTRVFLTSGQVEDAFVEGGVPYLVFVDACGVKLVPAL